MGTTFQYVGGPHGKFSLEGNLQAYKLFFFLNEHIHLYCHDLMTRDSSFLPCLKELYSSYSTRNVHVLVIGL